MGNLKSNKTKEEWDDLVNKTESHSDQVIGKMNINKFIEKAAEKHVDINYFNYIKPLEKEAAIENFIEGAKWMMENIEINLRRIK
jgi:patatin-like phospholipase/acyl hydrolase